MEVTSYAPGDRIAGKYVIERILGRGGMGIVLAARHEGLQERVAIKVLAPEVQAVPEAVARFTREARAAAKIRSEHVVRVFDVGELAPGIPYMAMEFLDGVDLANRLTEAPIPVDELLDYILQACEALAEAHREGIVHRDLKPANLFVTKRADGTALVKLLDFGISKARAQDEAGLTRTAVFMGSAFYAPPEQLLSARDADARSDVWALGVILYEALGRKLPFEGESVMEVAAKILQTAPTPLEERRPDVPVALCQAVMRCLEKKPENRYRDVAELALALAPFAPRSRVSVERVSRVIGGPPLPLASPAPAPSVAPAANTATATGVARPASQLDSGGGVSVVAGLPKTSNSLLAVVAVAGATLVVGAVVLARSHRPPPLASAVATTPDVSLGAGERDAAAATRSPLEEHIAALPVATERAPIPSLPAVPKASTPPKRTPPTPASSSDASAPLEPPKRNPLHVDTK